VKKIVLVLAVALTLSVFASSQAAWAQSPNLSGDCVVDMQNDVLLRDSEIYASDPGPDLYKVEMSNGSSCKVGPLGAAMTDLALDQANQILYGISQSPAMCWTIDRTDGTSMVVDNLHVVGVPGTLINDLNSFEIDSNGKAWVAGLFGNLYRMDLSNCELTPKILDMRSTTAPLVTISASGDLIWDVVNGNRLFLTAFTCEGCPAGNNGLYEINTFNWEIKFVADTGFEKVFAGDFVKGTQNLCFLTRQGELFETDMAGTNINGPGSFIQTAVEAFGGTALVHLVGGIGLDFDKTALFLAAAQSNLLWVSPFMLAGLGVVAFILARKSSFKPKIKQKINY